MVRRGMARSRSEAGDVIRSGHVLVSGLPAMKAATLVAGDEPITLAGPGRRFVSRGGEKLDGALERLGLDVAGRSALDAGASTGGFTDCLLQRGAERVAAVDVGYGQLDIRLRDDPRVAVLERTNVRTLRPADLPFVPDVVVADLSFISLRLVLPALAGCAAPGADLVLLVKPQFEAGRGDVGRAGVVQDPAAWERALVGVAGSCREHGVEVMDIVASALLGPAGNVEFFVHGTKVVASEAAPSGPVGSAVDEAVDEAVARAVREGSALRGRRGGGADA